MAHVEVHPVFDAFYYSFYLEGIYERFESSSIAFTARSFPDLASDCLAFIVSDRGMPPIKTVIDAYDGSRITNEAALAWCDVYGKVNLVRSLAPSRYAQKCIPIGPSFPVRVWDAFSAWARAASNYRRSVDYSAKGESINSLKEHFANYRRQYKYRLPLDRFVPGESRSDYVFYLATLWDQEEAPGTSDARALFIGSCKSYPGLRFEGGLVPKQNVSSETLDKYRPCLASMHVSISEWISKMQASAVAFNTPAVFGSLAWKLPEFMALGKAVISTPLVREMPAPLQHGVHVHYVSGSAESIDEALALLLSDNDYRESLGRNAREYYLTNLKPVRVIDRLVSSSGRTP
jgi:hypothetical protein